MMWYIFYLSTAVTFGTLTLVHDAKSYKVLPRDVATVLFLALIWPFVLVLTLYEVIAESRDQRRGGWK